MGLTTVQDNTILKRYPRAWDGTEGLTTVQDNTILKLISAPSSR